MNVQQSVKHRRTTRSIFQQEMTQNKECPYNLETLPPEVLELILRFLPYQDIAGPVRLVSKKFSSVATAILNNAFRTSGKSIVRDLKHLNDKIHATDSDLELFILAKAYNNLELVEAQYYLLRAVVWRYTHPPLKQKFSRLCFYGGAILDELDIILRQAKKNPEKLFDKDGPAPIVLNFATMCKKFMNYFEKVSERKVNSRNTFVSGCKIVDILDCLMNGRELKNLRVSTGRAGRGTIVNMKLSYVLERSWFTCFDVPNNEGDDDDCWRDQQRFMYLRLRRLVGSVNEHHLERLHYERECFMQANKLLPKPKPLPSSTYSGYGEYAGKFYYYGNMNENAYTSKITDPWRRDLLRRKVPEKTPQYNLTINIELRCSPELAPLAVRSMLNSNDLDNSSFTKSEQLELYLKLSTSCPASKASKLPSNIVWELRSPRQTK